MKDVLDDIINFLHKLLLSGLIIMLIILVIRFFVYTPFSFDNVIKLFDVIAWPLVVIIAFAFFRKVFTYLFFSMEEFNFFGNKGKLKNIQDVIDERTQQRLDEEKNEKERRSQIERMQGELEEAKSFGGNAQEQAKENLELANKIFEKYKESLEQINRLNDEMSKLRRADLFRKEFTRRRLLSKRERNELVHSENSKGVGTKEGGITES